MMEGSTYERKCWLEMAESQILENSAILEFSTGNTLVTLWT